MLTKEDLITLQKEYGDEFLKELDINNTNSILNYLKNEKIHYNKELLISSMDLFLLPLDDFKRKFERFKKIVGPNYVDELGRNIGLIEIMYR